MATHATLAPRRSTRRRFRRAGRPRVRKLRLLFVLAAFLGLATLSLLFGMLTSVASDLPQLQDAAVFSHYRDSYMYDESGNPIGPLAPASTPAIDNWSDISQNMVHAIVSVEDRGFWGESGISVRGLLRAAYSDLTGGQFEGGSTIPEEFIKNVRAQEDHRTVLEKLVEAGMAFQLTHVWKHTKILTQYLNTIYFGNGALGIEAAARVYFGSALGYDAANPTGEAKTGCGTPNAEDPNRKECASMLSPAQAALLAGMVANPTEFDPILHPGPAKTRRNLVLKDMYEQGYINHRQYVQGRDTKLPTRAEIQQPEEPSAAPYFTSWVEPLVIRALEKEGLSYQKAQYEAYYGGLKITLSLNSQMQIDAQQAVDEELQPYDTNLPTASLVAIDNSTGQVRAMVSGNDNNYQEQPFNLATLGYRQPGSSFKLFTLAAALSKGTITPYTEVDSRQITIPFVKQGGNAFYAANGTGRFPVHNFGNAYAGSIPMTVATATSDNSVFAQVGMKVGTALVARYAKRMGIRSPISRNPSMILGGLNTGVSALDMAHAYSTEANGGVKVYDPILGDIDQGPIGIVSIDGCSPCAQNGHPANITAAGTQKTDPVLKPAVASEIDYLLHGPVDDSYGTGTAAAISGVNVAGKTGTTSNYVDAWFCGWTKPLTVCVWVGYVNGGKPMLTQFDGKPVEGGTYPALIFHNFMVQALQVLTQQAEHKTSTITSPTSTEVVPTTSASTQATQTTASSTTTTQTPTSTSQTPPSSNSSATTTPSTQQPSSGQSTTTPAVIPPGGSSTTGGSGF